MNIIIKYLEANLNRAPIDASDPDNLDFAEVENAD